MKTMLNTPVCFVVVLGFVSGNAFALESWTKSQQEIVARVDAWQAASLAGDVDAIMNLTAPGFMGWDLAKPAPVDRATYRAEQDAFFKRFKVLESALPVTAVQIDGDTAAAHGRYNESVQLSSGQQMRLQGSWTASLRRSGGQWLFLSLGCLEDRTPVPAATTLPSGERKTTFTAEELERRLFHARWRTDYYICTGIAYAKSRGQTLEDFMEFVGNNHTIGTNSTMPDAFTRIARLASTIHESERDGKMEVVSQTDKELKLRFKRAYKANFAKGPMLGVTLEEFERCYWGHLVILFKRQGFETSYRIEGDDVFLEMKRG